MIHTGKSLEIGDFSVVVLADNYNPSILNADFLKYKEVVPNNWELAMPPICTPAVSQVAFTSGVNIVGQQNKLTFWGALEDGDILIDIPSIAINYIEAVPYLIYRSIGINFRGYVVVDTAEEAESFVSTRLITPGAWKNFQGISPTNVTVQLTYPREKGNFTLTIQSGFVEKSSNQPLPAILFSANFHQDIIEAENSTPKVNYAKNIIESWKKELELFKLSVNEIL